MISRSNNNKTAKRFFFSGSNAYLGPFQRQPNNTLTAAPTAPRQVESVFGDVCQRTPISLFLIFSSFWSSGPLVTIMQIMTERFVLLLV